MSDELKVRRLFIGRISPLVLEKPNDLSTRLARFGQLKSELEIHKNEARNQYFAYIDIEISEKEYAKLKHSLHNVNYKGSKLVVDLAKEDYLKRWEKDAERSNEEYEHKMITHEYNHYKLIQNKNKTFRDMAQVIYGRMRAQPRKDIKKLTFRVNINGNTKVYKCHKTKLWGYERERKLRDLCYRFSHGVWKDGNDHIVERPQVNLKNSAGDVMMIEDVKDVEGEDDEEIEEEVNKNTKVLASLFDSFDFDKQLDYKEDVDEENADSEYEYDGAVENGAIEVKDANYLKTVKKNIESIKKGTETKGVVSFEDDQDAYVDNYLTRNIPVSYNSDDEESVKAAPGGTKEVVQEGDDEDLEFIPSFGTDKAEAEIPSQLVEGTISHTETLRTLFNTAEEDDKGFRLVTDAEDIDNTQNIAPSIETLTKEYSILPVSKSKTDKGLFFPHFESPFLVAQSQLNKLSVKIEFDGWEDKFWEKRGDWNDEFRKRKREAVKQQKKKSARTSRTLL